MRVALLSIALTLLLIVAVADHRDSQKQNFSARQMTATGIKLLDEKLTETRREWSDCGFKHSQEVNGLNFKIVELEKTVRRLEKRIEALENPKPKFMPLTR